MTEIDYLSTRLLARRKSLGYTLSDVGKATDLNPSTIQRYETGTIQRIKLPVIESLANFLNVNPAWLIGKTDVMEPVRSGNPVKQINALLTPDQEAVLKLYDSAPPELQKAALAVLKSQ